MLESIASFFKNYSIHKVAFITTIASNIMKAVEQEFSQDTNAKNEAIDTLIGILQSLKSIQEKAE